MNPIIQLTNTTIDNQLHNAQFAIIDFTADWCPPCHMMKPIYQKLAQKYGTDVGFFAVDSDEYPEITMRYGVRSLPTFMFFHKGQAVKRIVGAMPAAKFEALLVEFMQNTPVAVLNA